MATQFELIRQQQKDSWNKISSGWKKWDGMTMDFLKPMGDEIIRVLQPSGGDIVLDIAAGTGEPGLTIAQMLNGGKVYITDIAEKMVEISRENALRRGIDNVEALTCDVSELPFPDNTFDAISCRFGFMFFPDMELAAREMNRVLKPGGRMATSVWNVSEKNFWVTAIMGSINKNIQMPSPVPGAPGMFRCAADGFMTDLLLKTGFKNISETEIYGKLDCGNAEGYWNFMNEVAGPVAAALSNVDNDIKVKIKAEVIHSIDQKYPEGSTMVDSNAFIIYAEK
ncbi:class I SAM-dependent methyltransferase [Mucilaginibacter gotjawali]|uniref:Ubiquinone/menaquinone biosynthesis C-methylase UbiE n=2 Tax=Mucilaginibacter gotjawali TaxID=1550579 RepID=A0A839SC42_9SPHI|nr:class I SAM-dependent methyltransferase [Mucilaginibacter gotjawali]MBB3054259.1 ubiquinone/menaquinone biosynthesis C-methylase UbiE [Mucilaginibacter gotjawali]BAU51907.1 Ubiquinone/menaquinone biosynthesis C-methyltransferase UbiE [Mucilaginibacter gotjawali]